MRHFIRQLFCVFHSKRTHDTNDGITTETCLRCGKVYTYPPRNPAPN